MKPSYYFVWVGIIILTSVQCTGQKTGHVVNEDFDKRIHSLLQFSIPVISVEEAYSKQGEIVFLDAREKEEYTISHINNAIYVGYTKPDLTALEALEKDTPIVVYCSVGYRSEKVGELLKDRGYTDVRNLYGSLFEWTNRDLPIVDKEGTPTDSIHTYNARWSKWVENKKIVKVY